VVGHYELGNEQSGSVKHGELVSWATVFLKMMSAPKVSEVNFYLRFYQVLIAQLKIQLL
jgi:hypothetical protein